MFQVPGRRADSLRIGRYTNFLDTTGGLIATAPHVVPVGAGMRPQEALHEVAHPVHGPQRVLAVGNALEQLRVVALALQ